jgi:hypothetical protein
MPRPRITVRAPAEGPLDAATLREDREPCSPRTTRNRNARGRHEGVGRWIPGLRSSPSASWRRPRSWWFWGAARQRAGSGSARRCARAVRRTLRPSRRTDRCPGCGLPGCVRRPERCPRPGRCVAGRGPRRGRFPGSRRSRERGYVGSRGWSGRSPGGGGPDREAPVRSRARRPRGARDGGRSGCPARAGAAARVAGACHPDPDAPSSRKIRVSRRGSCGVRRGRALRRPGRPPSPAAPPRHRAR